MHRMHLLPGVAIQPNLELKTRPQQLLGSLPLVIALPDGTERFENHKNHGNIKISFYLETSVANVIKLFMVVCYDFS